MELGMIEMGILYSWGCEDYGLTLQRLKYLSVLTVDWDTKRIINNLYTKLLFACTEDAYKALYDLSRLSMDRYAGAWLKGVQSRIRRRKEALKKAEALGMYCIPGGKSRKGAVNG